MSLELTISKILKSIEDNYKFDKKIFTVKYHYSE